MSTSAIHTLEQARDLARDRLNAAPDFALFQSAWAQLDYLCQLASGAETDRSRLGEINVGLYAIREFEESDPELARVLKDAQFIADKMSKGLKV